MWSPEEVKILCELWSNPKVSQEDIRMVFPGRSWSSIKNKADTLDLKPFSSYRNAEINVEFYKKLMGRVKG